MENELASASDKSAIADLPSRDGTHTPIKLTISRLSPEDLAAIVEAELLSFSGTDPEEVLARRLHPFRADLVRSQIQVPRWPDFLPTLRKYEELLKDERNIVLGTVAGGRRDHEKLCHFQTERHVPIGMAWLRLPSSPNSTGVSGEAVKRLTKRYVSSARERLQNTVSPPADGTDFTFLEVFKAEVRHARREIENQILNNRPYASLEIIFVHPAYRGTGAGAALLLRCVEIADTYCIDNREPGLPILLESTCAATPLYLRFGFREVYRSRLTYGGNVYEWPVMLRDPNGGDREGQV